MARQTATIAAPIERSINELTRLPGIGRRLAQRLVFHLLSGDRQQIGALTQALEDLTGRVRHCSVCGNFTENDPCPVCTDNTRDRGRICVVEHCYDVAVLERGGSYNGLYHVLGGVVSPLHGKFETDIRLPQLLDRLDEVEEIILATNPNTEGEATALLIQRRIQEKGHEGMRITKIARGLPAGSDLEYADDATLSEAIKRRVEI